MLTQVDASNDLSTALWNSGWSGNTRHDASVDGNAQRVADFEWEQTGSQGVLMWGTTGGELDYRPFTTSLGWQGPGYVTLGGASLHSWVVLRRVPDAITSDMPILGVAQQANLSIGSINWTGGAVQANEVHDRCLPRRMPCAYVILFDIMLGHTACALS